jgi:hypothetical protein
LGTLRGNINGGIVEIRSPFSPPEGAFRRDNQTALSFIDKTHTARESSQRYRNQKDVGVGTIANITNSTSFGFKSVLGGGYQSFKPEEIKAIKGCNS